jgi:glycosyltransferase involved in cell wall biosynthesis
MIVEILLVPPNDWLNHPLSSRLHFIFERLALNHQVHVMNFLRMETKQLRSTNTKLHNATIVPAKDLSIYYILNAIYHYKKIEEVISKNNIEVVVASNILASSFACIAARRAQIPIIYDYLDHFPDSASLYYKNPGKRKLVKNVVEVIVKQNLQRADKIVVPSKSLEKILASYGIHKERLALIPNGVDLNAFRPRNRIDSLKKIQRLDLTDTLLLVFVGSIESRFDLETPILSVEKLAAKGLKVKFLIVGPGLSKYNIYLKSKYSSFSSVEFVGFVDSELVPYYINAADICIAPYRVMEMNFSITLKLLEYLACEKKVFTTDIPDVRKVFEKNVTVYRDSNDLEEKILDIYRRKSEYSVRANELSMLLSQYSWDTLTLSYENLLRNLVGR